jgi:hypothetical protein
MHLIGVIMRPLRIELVLDMNAGDPAVANSRTVRIVCSGSPNPAPASAISGTDTARATSPAMRTCSSIVKSGSLIAREAPLTYPPV